MTTIIADVRTHNQTLDLLESLVDRHDLPALIEALAEICSAKADHVQESWQDETLAKYWDRRAALLLNAAEKARKLPVF